MAVDPWRPTTGPRAAWLASSVVLEDRQIGICRNPDGTIEMRVGDGTHLFFDLPNPGGGAINDESPAATSTYSSEKITNLVDASVIGLINDTTPATDATYSSAKVDSLVVQQVGDIVDDTEPLESRAYSSVKVEQLFSEVPYDAIVPDLISDSGSATRGSIESYLGAPAAGILETPYGVEDGDFARDRFGGTRITRIGSQSLESWTNQAYHNEAFGRRALRALTKGNWNTAIGGDALYSLDGAGASDPKAATRNISVGWNSSRFNKIGFENVAIGRNAMQCHTDPYAMVFIGAGAGSRQATYGFASNIENYMPSTGKHDVVAVGMNAASWADANYLTAIGSEALKWNKLGQSNSAVGYQALTSLESHLAFNGKPQDLVTLNGTYAGSGTSVVCTLAGHGVLSGDMVSILFSGASEQTYLTVTSATTNTFTCDLRGANIGTATGTFTVSIIVRMSQTTVGASINTYNTAIGALAGNNLKTAVRTTAVGANALRYMYDGTTLATTLSNATGLGERAYVSGDYQVQVGSNVVDVYTATAIQNRSDARDKTDIRDTELGLDFIKALRPVDYRWDYRTDYVDYDDDGNPVQVEKDGSRKRTRFHHGLIAQEVAETAFDFGGLQDHSINGGGDVMSLGYTELIAPLIKSVQELSARIEAVEAA